MRKLSKLTLLAMIALTMFSACQKEEEIPSDEVAEHALIQEAMLSLNETVEEEHWTTDNLPGDGVHFEIDPSGTQIRSGELYNSEVCGNCINDDTKTFGRIESQRDMMYNGNQGYEDKGVVIYYGQGMMKPNSPNCHHSNTDFSKKHLYYYSIKHWTVNKTPMKTLKSGYVYNNLNLGSYTFQHPNVNEPQREGFLVYLYKYSNGQWCKMNSGWWTVKKWP